MRTSSRRLVKIDFDWLGEPLIRRLVWVLRLQYVCRVAECELRRTKKGYHVYIRGEFDDDMPLRALLLDDEYHIDVDWRRRVKKLPGYGVVFNCKVRKGRLEYVEEPVGLEELVEKVLRLPSPL